MAKRPTSNAVLTRALAPVRALRFTRAGPGVFDVVGMTPSGRDFTCTLLAFKRGKGFAWTATHNMVVTADQARWTEPDPVSAIRHYNLFGRDGETLNRQLGLSAG